jgi:hypothetical protein
MAILGTILVGLAALAMLVFAVQILIMAFKTSVVWGLVSLLIPFGILVYVFKNWQQTKKPFLYSLACLPVQLVGYVLMFMGAASSAPQ